MSAVAVVGPPGSDHDIQRNAKVLVACTHRFDPLEPILAPPFWLQGSISCLILTAVPRANRYFLPGKLYHLTHRCHDRQFLFKFAQDRNRYRQIVWESLQRFASKSLAIA